LFPVPRVRRTGNSLASDLKEHLDAVMIVEKEFLRRAKRGLQKNSRFEKESSD